MKAEDEPMTPSFNCYLVTKDDSGKPAWSVSGCHEADLPPGEVLMRVVWSSLNYKDAMAARGHPGVVKHFPHVPGVDAVGVVRESANPQFRPGQWVMACAYGLGAERWGAWAELLRVPAEWTMPLPAQLTPRESMMLGTAGFTAAMCVQSLRMHEVLPGDANVVVTGASGGVGSIAVRLLAKLGYRVTAVSGKPAHYERLRAIGAAEVLPREALLDNEEKPLLSARWAGGVDTVGGRMLSSLVRQTRHSGCVAACGVAGGPELSLTVYPLILRGVTLAGIEAAWFPMDRRQELWERLAGPWRLEGLDAFTATTELTGLDTYIASILRGQIVGRVIVRVGTERTQDGTR